VYCPACGKQAPADVAFCPFCAAELRTQEPAQAAPSPPPAQPAPVAPSTAPAVPPTGGSSASCWIIGGLVGAFLFVALVAVVFLVYLAVTKAPSGSPEGPQAGSAAEHTSTATEPPDADGTEAAPPTQPEAPPQEGPSEGAAALDLSLFEGPWQFVGEPGPWGEGPGMELWQESGKVIGQAGFPDEKWDITLTERSGELEGESTRGGETIQLIVRPEPSSTDLLTVLYRYEESETQEWITRVATRGSEGGE